MLSEDSPSLIAREAHLERISGKKWGGDFFQLSVFSYHTGANESDLEDKRGLNKQFPSLPHFATGDSYRSWDSASCTFHEKSAQIFIIYCQNITWALWVQCIHYLQKCTLVVLKITLETQFHWSHGGDMSMQQQQGGGPRGDGMSMDPSMHHYQQQQFHSGGGHPFNPQMGHGGQQHMRGGAGPPGGVVVPPGGGPGTTDDVEVMSTDSSSSSSTDSN